jgi:hypothetical protein
MKRKDVVWCVQFRERYLTGRWSGWKFMAVADNEHHAKRMARDWADSQQECRVWIYEPRSER